MNKEVRLPESTHFQALVDFRDVCESIQNNYVNSGDNPADRHLSYDDMARYVVAASVLLDKIDELKDFYATELKDAGIAVYEFIDLHRKLQITKGRAVTEISKDAFDELSLEEIKKASKLTEKGLIDIKRNDIIEKYKKVLREASPTLSVRTL